MQFPKWRPEIQILEERGYEFDDPSQIVGMFERKIADWARSPYAVAVDCSTHAMELALRYTGPWKNLSIPRHTYLSVPQTAKKLGAQVEWSDEKWQGVYRLSPSPVIDASLRFKPGMYEPDTFMCLSFQIKKRIPIGRGGMILTDNAKAYNWLKRAVYDGRTPETVWRTDLIHQMGYHYYMTPEDAARGLLLFEDHLTSTEDLGGFEEYPDLTGMDYFERINQWS